MFVLRGRETGTPGDGMTDDVLTFLMKAGAGVTLLAGVLAVLLAAVWLFATLIDQTVKTMRATGVVIEYAWHRKEFREWMQSRRRT